MIYELFTQALELPIDLQEDFVRKQDLDDKSLNTLLNLLTSHHKSHDFTFSPSLSLASDQLITQNIPTIGDKVSVYQVTGNLGQGGMGSVFSAKRIDDAFEQKVAIKIISPQVKAIIKTKSFNNEASLMAKLQHPNIRKIHDAGTLDSGVHYLVMEFIDGIKLDEYLKSTSLTIRERLVLFTKICHAVHHAHQHQVIHADIKAANILVDKHGEPHVLDFGIAKLFDSHNQNVASYYQAFSLDYASPELIKTGEASILCDIYSLGKLFELIINTSPRKKDILLKHNEELTSMINCATEHSPNDRYQSVCQLKSDINLFISGYVVTAHQADYIYRFKKFVISRHPKSVTAGSIFAVICTVLIINLITQYYSLESEKYQTDIMLDKFSLVLNLDPDAKSNVEIALANNYESRDEDEKALVLYQNIISRFDALTDKGIAFNSGSHLVQLLIKTKRYKQINIFLAELKSKIEFLPSSNLPITAEQAMLYHYLIDSTYNRSNSHNDKTFEFHTKLMQDIKKTYWNELSKKHKDRLVYSMNVTSSKSSKVTSYYYPELQKTNTEKKSLFKGLTNNVQNHIVQIMDETYNGEHKKLIPNAKKINFFVESSSIFWASTNQRPIQYEYMRAAKFNSGIVEIKGNKGIYTVEGNIITTDFGEGPESDSYIYVSSELALSVPITDHDLTILTKSDLLNREEEPLWNENELNNNEWYHIYDDSLDANQTIIPSIVKIHFQDSLAQLSTEEHRMNINWNVTSNRLTLKGDNAKTSITLIKLFSNKEITIVQNTNNMTLSLFVKNEDLAQYIFKAWQKLL